MQTLLYFGFWAGLIFVMMRFGCGAHIMGHGHGKETARDNPARAGDPGIRWAPPRQDADPVCGKTVVTDSAKSSVHNGNVYFFWSRDCREDFEAAPDIYFGGGPGHRKLEHSHV